LRLGEEKGNEICLLKKDHLPWTKMRRVRGLIWRNYPKLFLFSQKYRSEIDYGIIKYWGTGQREQEQKNARP